MKHFQDYDNFVLSPKEINRYRYDMTSASSTLKLERIDPTPIILPDQTLRDLAEKKLDNETIKTIGKLMRQVKFVYTELYVYIF